MDFSKLSYEDITSIADQLDKNASNMASKLDEVKKELDNVGKDGVWSGDAASKKKAEFDALSAKFPDFSNAIKDCKAYLMSVVEGYKAVDEMINKG